MRVSLLGYPNSGKTSIFNLLSFSNKKVANYSGVTVDVAKESFKIENEIFEIVDLPGINSLSSFSDSKDEIVVSKYIQDNKDDIYLNIVNIANLERNLLLTLSAISKGMKVILVVNMIDTVKLSSNEIKDIQKILKDDLNIPVVMFSAKKQLGVAKLKEKIKNYVTNTNTNTTTVKDFNENVSIIKKVTLKLPKIKAKSGKVTEFLDAIFLNKVLSIPLFLLIIYSVLLLTMNIHIIFSGLIDALAGIVFVNLPKEYLSKYLPEVVLIIFADGIGGGIQTMLTFLPIIFTLFFLLGILEQSGYMARQAFIADGIMQKLGLPGKAFISLVMGLGCTAACSSGCRTLERESDRRLSLMISPSISCSAKLPVYIYLCFIAFGAMAVNMVLLLYFLGILFAIVNGIFLSKSLFRASPLPFIIDLPDYRMPDFLALLKNSYKRVKNFLIGLGKTIIPIIAIITFLGSISFKGEIISVDSNHSILAKSSSFITPVLEPIGISENNWQATLSLIAGFLAKEVVVATLDAVYFPINEEEVTSSWLDSVKSALADFSDQLFNRNHLDVFDIGSSYSLLGNIDAKKEILYSKFNGFAGMFAFLLFVLIYTPCISAMGAIAREISAKWAWIVGLWSVFNAFMISALFYQVAIGLYTGLVFTSIFIVVYTIIFFMFKHYGKKSSSLWNNKFVFSQKKPN